MADNRNSYKGQTIGLEFYESDFSGSISSVDRVIILQDKEVCYTTTSISLLSPGVWGISLNTDEVLYSGDFQDHWILNGGLDKVEKELSITNLMTTTPERSTGDYAYYSKDLLFEVKSDGDLYRILNESSVALKIEAVCLTVRGSLYNEPNYGSNLYKFLFSSSPTIEGDIQAELETQLQIQVPNIKVKRVVVTVADINAYNVKVEFYNTTSSNSSELFSLTNLVSLDQIK